METISGLRRLSEHWIDVALSIPDAAYYLIVVLCVACFLAIITWVVKSGVKPMATSGERKITPQERVAIEDALEFAMDEAMLKGKMSKKSARYWKNRLATDYGLTGLVLPKKLTKKLHPFKAKQIKEDIKKRLGNGLYKVKATLPKEDTPPWEDSPSKNGSKRTSAKFQKFLNAKAA